MNSSRAHQHLGSSNHHRVGRWSMAAVVGAAIVAKASGEASLAGKRAVVVGGTSGIGRGIALRMAVEGADVTVVGRSDRGILEEMRQHREGGTFKFVAQNRGPPG